MTDKKFTDEEIIQALECHINAEDCVSCGIRSWCDEIILTELVLDLVNRQKAEIEKLKSKNEILSHNADNAFQEGLNERRELFEPEIKSEAYKDFVNRLKNSNEFYNCIRAIGSVDKMDSVINCIDALLKEMVGEKE